MLLRYLWILGAAVVASYTMAYAILTWRGKNRVGAVGVAIIALIAVLLPAAVLLLR
ncbi:MAG: hypothetical protein ACYC9Q_00850 [Bacillota bacterium]